jgi:hypothetical protein
VTSSNNWNNTNGVDALEVTVQVRTTDGEHLDPTSMVSISFADLLWPGGDGFLLDGSAFTAEHTDRDRFTLTGSIPAGQTATADEIVVGLTGVTDPSGNAACETSVEGFLGANQYQTFRFGFEDGAQGWTGMAPWEQGVPINVGPSTGYAASTRVFATDIDGVYTDASAQSSVLSSPDFLSPDNGGGTNLLLYYWGEFDQSGDVVQVYWVPDVGAEQYLGQLDNWFGSWDQFNTTFYGNSQLGHLELRWVTNGDTFGGPGFYIDDISFSGTWYAP